MPNDLAAFAKTGQVQLGIPVDAALSVLRAHAFAEACSLTAVATQVIEHRVRLGPLQN